MVRSFRWFTYREYVLTSMDAYLTVCKHSAAVTLSPHPYRRSVIDCGNGAVGHHAEKLRRRSPRSPGVSRRQQYSASTKRALVEVADGAVHRAGVRRDQPGPIVAGPG